MEALAPEIPESSGPRVSVVVVSQNQYSLLKPSLEALAGRTDPALSEVIVVDCGSIDGSERIDQEFENITVMRLPRNFGWTKAVNIGTRTAKGEFLFLLPNGCMAGGDTITRLLTSLEANPKAGAVCPAGDFYMLPKAGETELQEVRPEQAQYPFDQPVLFPKVALVSMNFLPDAYGQYFADAELFQKMRTAGKSILVLEDLKVPRTRAPHSMFSEDLDLADRMHGLQTFYGKNYGFMAGLGFWLGQTFKALVSFKFGLFSKLLGGAKVDGL